MGLKMRADSKHQRIKRDETPILYQFVNELNDFICRKKQQRRIVHLALQTLLTEYCIREGYKPINFADDLIQLQDHFNSRHKSELKGKK
jgi:hypothetical protein